MAVAWGRGQEHFSHNGLKTEREAIRVGYGNRGSYSLICKLVCPRTEVPRTMAFLEFSIRFRLSFRGFDQRSLRSGTVSSYYHPVLFRS